MFLQLIVKTIKEKLNSQKYYSYFLYVSWEESWELNLVPLQEQEVLFTAEPSLQPPFLFALLEDLGSIPSTYMAAHNCL